MKFKPGCHLRRRPRGYRKRRAFRSLRRERRTVAFPGWLARSTPRPADAGVVSREEREEREEHEDADRLLIDLLAWRAIVSRMAS